MIREKKINLNSVEIELGKKKKKNQRTATIAYACSNLTFTSHYSNIFICKDLVKSSFFLINEVI